MFLDEADLDISNEDVTVWVQHSVRARQDKGRHLHSYHTMLLLSQKHVTMDKYR